MNVNPGELKKKIEIIKQDISYCGGIPSGKWTVVRRPRAKVSQYSAKEKFLAGTEMADVNMRFLIRHGRTELDETMLVRYKGMLYEIKMINNYSESDEYVEIIGEKKGPG